VSEQTFDFTAYGSLLTAHFLLYNLSGETESMQNRNPSVVQSYNTLVIIWAALFSAQFVFLLVIFIAKPELFRLDLTKPVLDENAPIILIFALLAVTNLLFSFVMKKKFLTRAFEKQNAGLIQTAMIVGCALCESVTLLGFVIAFGFAYQYFFIWFALGIVGMIFHFPKRDNLHLATYKQTQKF
jgi:F0F1-type ATP synthase membrane subunit c/vacuolar-type H+-ATPase subunit K